MIRLLLSNKSTDGPLLAEPDSPQRKGRINSPLFALFNGLTLERADRARPNGPLVARYFLMKHYKDHAIHSIRIPSGALFRGHEKRRRYQL